MLVFLQPPERVSMEFSLPSHLIHVCIDVAKERGGQVAPGWSSPGTVAGRQRELRFCRNRWYRTIQYQKHIRISLDQSRYSSKFIHINLHIYVFMNWSFPEIGLPPDIIQFNGHVHPKPSILGLPPCLETTNSPRFPRWIYIWRFPERGDTCIMDGLD